MDDNYIAIYKSSLDKNIIGYYDYKNNYILDSHFIIVGYVKDIALDTRDQNGYGQVFKDSTCIGNYFNGYIYNKQTVPIDGYDIAKIDIITHNELFIYDKYHYIIGYIPMTEYIELHDNHIYSAAAAGATLLGLLGNVDLLPSTKDIENAENVEIIENNEITQKDKKIDTDDDFSVATNYIIVILVIILIIFKIVSCL